MKTSPRTMAILGLVLLFTALQGCYPEELGTVIEIEDLTERRADHSPVNINIQLMQGNSGNELDFPHNEIVVPIRLYKSDGWNDSEPEPKNKADYYLYAESHNDYAVTQTLPAGLYKAFVHAERIVINDGTGDPQGDTVYEWYEKFSLINASPGASFEIEVCLKDDPYCSG